jgi:hypothetical protein
MSSNKRCGIGTQPDGGCGYLFGRSHPSHWLEVRKLFLEFRIPAGNPVDHFRMDHTRAHRIDANTGFGVFQRCCLGEAYNRMFTRHVSRQIPETDQARHRRHIDDRATGTLIEQLPNLPGHAQPDAFQVDGDRSVEIGVSAVHCRRHFALDARVVERPVQPAESSNGRLNEPIDICRVAYVATNEDCLAA